MSVTATMLDQDRPLFGRSWVLPALAGLFLALGLMQAWPQFNAPFHFLPGDDWTDYHERALNVLQQGLAMPGVQGPYTVPAGFLYVYFLALCYALLGPHPAPVFLVHSAMLGVTVWLLYASFAPGLRRRSQLVLLVALAAFAILDMQRNYVMRLLSENLLLLLAALFFRLLFLACRQGRGWALAAALAVLGAIPLTRPNAILFLPPLLLWLLLMTRRGPGRQAPLPLDRRWLAVGLMAMLLVFSAMGLRNHAATGHWTFFTPAKWDMFEAPGLGLGLRLVQHPDGPQAPREGVWPAVRLVARAIAQDPLKMTEGYARRLLYCLGFLPLHEPAYNWRPHWMLAWGLYLAGLGAAWRRGRGLGLEQTALALYIWPMLAGVAGVSWVASYGFRFQVPIILPLVCGAVWGLETLIHREDARRAQSRP